MSRLHLHTLPGEKRAAEVANLLAKLFSARRRAVVWVEDEGRAKILDDYLWTFGKHTFLPHAVAAAGVDVSQEPVVVLSEPANPNGADVLVVADGLPPLDWAAEFAEVHDLLPPGSPGEERRSHWDGWTGDRSEDRA